MEDQKTEIQILHETVMEGNEDLVIHLSKLSTPEVLEYSRKYAENIMRMKALAQNEETIQNAYRNLNLIESYYRLRLIGEADPNDNLESRSFSIG